MPITVTPTSIPDVLVIEPRIFSDDRGWFFESFNEKDFSAAVGEKVSFVQDNQAKRLITGMLLVKSAFFGMIEL
jgi:dTDP-4-dehydrorhamnose 3,5-epimerase